MPSRSDEILISAFLMPIPLCVLAGFGYGTYLAISIGGVLWALAALLCAPATVTLGIYSFIFGVPEWVSSLLAGS